MAVTRPRKTRPGRKAVQDGAKKKGSVSAPCCRAGSPAAEDLRGSLIDPATYMKVVAHPLRRKLLSRLAEASADGPVTKKQLAELLGVEYESVNYQLNRHLSDFWKVRELVKVRGAYQEYIAAEPPNAIYVNLGSGGTFHIIDPLAGLFGKLGEVGTRCDRCARPALERQQCLEGAMAQECFAIDEKERSRMEALLEQNGRHGPLTPVDHMLSCAVIKGMENKQCVLVLGGCGCAGCLTKEPGQSSGRSSAGR